MTGTEVTNWDQELAAEAKALAKTERPTVQRFSFKSGVLAYGDQDIAGNKIDVVVIASLHENVYYKDKWDPDRVSPPACYAYSETGENMVPHPDIKEPQSPNCDSCWANKFKSAENGKGKACSNRRKLAVVPKYEKAEDYANAEIGIMSLPPMSVKNWANYVNFLAGSVQRAPWGVMTQVGVVPDRQSQFKVTFSPVDKLENEFLAQIRPKTQAGKMLLEVPYDLTPPEEREETDDKPAKKQKF